MGLEGWQEAGANDKNPSCGTPGNWRKT